MVVVTKVTKVVKMSFWTLAGGENSSKYDLIRLSPEFHPLTLRLAQKPSLFSDFDGFY